MKQRYIMLISVAIVALFIMMAFSDSVYSDKNNNMQNSADSSNNVKIGNITFMHNYNISSNYISTSNINKTSINRVYSYENRDVKNNDNNTTSYKYDYIATNSTNYLLQYYNNSNVKYTIAYTDTFKHYKVEIGDIIYRNGNGNISYIYANIVPINSSKILLGNEFTLDNKGTYGNIMEKLINSIKLISFNYMYSSNKTLDRFGIEYSYIASAMGSMLKSTNNEIKNVSIDKTIEIAVDWNILYDVAIVGLIASILILLLPGVGLVFDSMLVFWIYDALFVTESSTSIIRTLWDAFPGDLK
ncbi:hypothetical protein [Ferroplasma sp.]|uniref:hypothetical protein n=1 Tax=Ferroplasma sp. TaxID=2591003 RepID=UPI00260489ED|nr:hypothetical protein [Ferroplasma sp.]